MINLTRAKRISGWMADDELEFLAKVAQKSNEIIEIGSYYGRSCRALADNSPGIIHSVDPYNGEYPTLNPGIILDFDDEVYNTFLYNLEDHLESGKVIQHRKLFKDITDINSDFIFIDGDHSYEGCLADIIHARTLLQHGIIAGHDYGMDGFPGVIKSVNEEFGQPNVVNTIWWIQL